MKLLDNAYRLATTPNMARQWVRWNLGSLGLVPHVDLPEGGRVAGFENFTEFWTAEAIIPTPAELIFIKAFAGCSGVLLDVGANIGCFALTLARLRPGCTIHAFEPSPHTRERLEANLARNPQTPVVVQPVALGKVPGHAQFLHNARSPGMSRLVAAEESVGATTIEVEISTVDRFLAGLGNPPVAFIKIDVEGFEGDVLRGAESMLRERRCQAGLIELSMENLAQAGSSVEDLIQTLQSVGWQMHVLQADGSAGKPVVAVEVKAGDLTNCVILPVNVD